VEALEERGTPSANAAGHALAATAGAGNVLVAPVSKVLDRFINWKRADSSGRDPTNTAKSSHNENPSP